jgi:SAM-dependent methyltransferase
MSRVTFADPAGPGFLMAWYRNWFGTRYYALLYGHRDEREAKAWVDMILGRLDIHSGSSVLDLACGRGRHARWFIDAGLLVSGVDIDPSSIAEAKANLPGGDFKVHDMRDPVDTGAFDLVCCLFTSIGYFDDLRDEQLVFDAAFAALRPGGHFVVDFMNTVRVIDELVHLEELERNGIRFTIHRRVENDVIVKQITVLEGPVEEQFQERVKALRPEQLENMALAAGFSITGRTDGPVATNFDPVRSDRYVLWLTRPLS